MDIQKNMHPREIKNNLSFIATSGKKLSNLVNDIIDFVRLKHRDIDLRLMTVDLKTLPDVVFEILKYCIGGKEALDKIESND